MTELAVKIREKLNIVVVGHVDHGKSTLIGRLLFDTNSLSSGAIEKVKKISAQNGKPFEYAYLLDAFEEEQKQGITIDTTNINFSTEKRDYVIIDAPGHKEFLKNMISGASSAEAALLMIDANEGIQEQSRRHGYILSLLGIKKVFVIVNKMDLIGYSEAVYNDIMRNFNKFLSNLNIYPIEYIPVSAFNGENITIRSDNLAWYKGVTVIEALDLIQKDPEAEDKPLRFSIQDVYKFDTRRIIAGRIEAGTLKVGDEITISPSGKTTKVKTIENWPHEHDKNYVSAGMSVGITVEDEFFNKRGEVISHNHNKPQKSNLFNANIFWMGKNPLVKGKTYKLKLTTQEVECEVFSINRVIDSSNLTAAEDFTAVNRNEVAEVTIKTREVVCFDEFAEYRGTGRFVIVEDYNVSGGGIVLKTDDTLKNRILEPKSKSLKPRTRLVTREQKEKKLGQKAKVIWLTGLTGCGKNEIAVKLEKKLFELGKTLCYLDSANLRFSISSDLEFNESGVYEQTRRIAEIANQFMNNGIITIVTSISRYKKARESAKEIIGTDDYLEFHIEVTEAVLKKRWDSSQECYYEKSDYPVRSMYIDDPNFNADEKVDLIMESIKDILQ
ncbi:MAG: adenylyl-sulfate kinase [Candidatus Melainabacteria bacterium GWF2_37_15]|nr:MAG: adenylyl-sulfate kinase [Candidatus Melainabacteria bacterium GWF2_37_15]